MQEGYCYTASMRTVVPKQGILETVTELEAIASLVTERLSMSLGEYFLDTSQGIPYFSELLGYGNQVLIERVLTDAILTVEGVLSVSDYQSVMSVSTRVLEIRATVHTIYGTTTIDTFPAQQIPEVPTPLDGEYWSAGPGERWWSAGSGNHWWRS